MSMRTKYARDRAESGHRPVTIQIGVAHLNHVAGDDRDENLKALCRRCHLRYDAPHHAEVRATRKDRERPILAMLMEMDGGKAA